MDEKKEYEEMIDMPESTCNVKVKKAKKPLLAKKTRKRRAGSEAVKNEVIDMVNAAAEKTEESDIKAETAEAQTLRETQTTAEIKQKAKSPKKKFKFAISGVGIGVFAIVALTLAIIMTNAVFPNSAINVFFRSVFGTEQKTVADTRVFSDFDVSLPYGEVSLDNGVITLNEKGSLYSTADGAVETLSKGEDGKFTMLIRHSDNFFTAITGMDYAYFGIGDQVRRTVPVGYANGTGATVCFLDGDNSVIASYTVSDDVVLWAA